MPGIFLGVNGGRPAYEADKLTDICELVVYKRLESRRITTL
jgi:hypothetical protein